MNLRPLLFIPPVILGVAGYLWMNSRPASEGETPAEAELAVRVQEIIPQPVSTSAVGYGRIEAEHSWSAIAEVQGRVVERARDVDVGSIVEEGQLLVSIDQTDYKLAHQKSLANIASIEAQLAELDRQEVNSKKLLEVEKRILEVAQAEVDRAESLLERGVGTQASVDTVRKTLLSQQVSITTLENTLALYPSQRNSLNATLAVRKAELAEAERSLEKSTIVAPFRGRVSARKAEVGQFVRVGDNLISLDSTDAAEVVAEIQPGAFGALVRPAIGASFPKDDEFESSRFVEVLNRLGVTATVRLASNEAQTAWEGEIVRQRGTMDNETSAMGIVVRIRNPLVANPGLNRPPLQAGSFVQVTFAAAPGGDITSIPRSAVQLSDQGAPFVYLANSENRLEIKQVELGAVLGDNVIVTSGLEGGETLILSRPNPPVPGMKLVPVKAEQPAQGN